VLCSGCFYAVARFAERASAQSFFPPPSSSRRHRRNEISNVVAAPADFSNPTTAACVLLLFYFLIKRATPFAAPEHTFFLGAFCPSHPAKSSCGKDQK